MLLSSRCTIITMGVITLNKSSNLYVRVEPSVKENAEMILSQLGIPLSNAVGIFLKQVILRRGLPFDVILPASQPIDISMLTEDELSSELEKGYADIESGSVLPVKKAFKSLRGELGI